MASRKKPTEEMRRRIEETRREAYDQADLGSREQRQRSRSARRRPRERLEASRRDPSEAMIRLRGLFAEGRRLLSPAGRAAGKAGGGVLSAIANPITSVLLALIRIPVALIAIAVDLILELGGFARRRLSRFTTQVRPVGTVALAGAAAAIALAYSQFTDFSGLAIGANLYKGEIGSVAPVPLTDLHTAGSAHYYVLLGVAGAALGFIFLTAGGRWRFGRLIALMGAITIAVTLLIDLPQGLDAGKKAIAYSDAEAMLVGGFWAQLACGVALLALGPLLSRYARQDAASSEPELNERPARRKRQGDPAASAGDQSDSREARRRSRAAGRARSGSGTAEAGA